MDWDRVMEGAAKEGFLDVFHLIFLILESGEVRWDFCNGEDKTLLYFLLNGSETNESKERRRDFLAWLMQPEQRHISDQLAKVVTKTDSAGVSVLALACKMAGEDDQLLDDETKPTRDNVIEWLLGLGADITNVPFNHAKDFLDRWFPESWSFVHKSGFTRCINVKGKQGEGDFRVTIKYGWQEKTEKERDLKWIDILSNSTAEEHSTLLK